MIYTSSFMSLSGEHARIHVVMEYVDNTLIICQNDLATLFVLQSEFDN